MSKINDGGPAFPVPVVQAFGDGLLAVGGMSLRAYLAGQVIGITAYSEPAEDAARKAVELADALIAELGKEAGK